MKITCISDLHGETPRLPGGDLLIVAGDLTACDKDYQYDQFTDWLLKQSYEKKVVVAGNHDGLIEIGRWFSEQTEGFVYLQDSGTEFNGLKIWGSPWTPEFFNWHFMLPRNSDVLKSKWDLIPEDADILITHGPSYGILDSTCPRPTKLDKVGCALLRDAVERVKPALHVFGHIHEDGCQVVNLKHHDSKRSHTICVNAAFMDTDYDPRLESDIVTIDL